MACKIVKGENFTAIQCTPYEYMQPGVYIDGDNKKPYEDDECRHEKRFENRGVLTCKRCGATYNENMMEWL